MSKIGRKPINIPDGIQVAIDDRAVVVRGKGGMMEVPKLPHVNVELGNGALRVTATGRHFQGRANWGTMVSLLENAIRGISRGFEKILEIEGIGFRAVMEGETLVLTVGFTHPVKFKAPAGVTVTVEKNIIKVRGVDKALVGQTAAEIRKIKKPEPYKGKGIRYQGEVIRRKAGKKAATVGGTGASS